MNQYESQFWSIERKIMLESNSELLKMEKVESVPKNPWLASSIYDFYYFCCPECDDKSKSKQDFINHVSIHAGVSLELLVLLN